MSILDNSSLVYTRLCIQFYKDYLDNRKKNNVIDIYSKIYHIKRFLRKMHDKDGMYKEDSTCYTLSLCIQLYLYSNGYDSKLIYGLTKVDQRIFGHAWVEFKYSRFNKEEVFNPGRVNLDEMKIIDSKIMVEDLLNYVFK
ncbi:lasso peptide biosynthesis protein [Xenorhabdus budapestensis]|uniref:Lasso peptide biosynthesis protein n=1 Tax=Xenorhabdus budapestensis TaxID=290110 RepID=A0ABX7VKF4_XENBU|nr:lasso peptide biosynthesis protein [Xenorhabdus budapestensis]QTL40396.1 lasso peptide biosynthesis protein [Xenorhabdus budapestensis]